MQSDVFSPLADFLTRQMSSLAVMTPWALSTWVQLFPKPLAHMRGLNFFPSKMNLVTLECHQVACQPGVSVALWSPLLANWNNGRTPAAPGIIYEAVL